MLDAVYRWLRCRECKLLFNSSAFYENCYLCWDRHHPTPVKPTLISKVKFSKRDAPPKPKPKRKGIYDGLA